ncbi:hypothetical protein D3C71_2171200 [compost metagenome]
MVGLRRMREPVTTISPTFVACSSWVCAEATTGATPMAAAAVRPAIKVVLMSRDLLFFISKSPFRSVAPGF